MTLDLPAAPTIPSGAWMAGQLQRVRDLLLRLTAPRPITTHDVGGELRAAAADLATDWRFRRRPTRLDTTLLTHGTLYAD